MCLNLCACMQQIDPTLAVLVLEEHYSSPPFTSGTSFPHESAFIRYFSTPSSTTNFGAVHVTLCSSTQFNTIKHHSFDLLFLQNFHFYLNLHTIEPSNVTQVGWCFNKHSNSFAKHFASHFKEENNNNVTRGDVRNIANVEVVWQGNLVSCVKTFKT